MAFDVDRRCAAALRRLHAAVDARCDREHIKTVIQGRDALKAVYELGHTLRRSAGQKRAWATVRRKPKEIPNV
jgi:hypothetical protein